MAGLKWGDLNLVIWLQGRDKADQNTKGKKCSGSWAMGKMTRNIHEPWKFGWFLLFPLFGSFWRNLAASHFRPHRPSRSSEFVRNARTFPTPPLWSEAPLTSSARGTPVNVWATPPRKYSNMQQLFIGHHSSRLGMKFRLWSKYIDFVWVLCLHWDEKDPNLSTKIPLCLHFYPSTHACPYLSKKFVSD